MFLRSVNNLNIDLTDNIEPSHLDTSLKLENKKNCDQARIYCFDDDDCQLACFQNGLFKCNNGVCVNRNVINTTAPKNECDASKGVLTFFVGNAMLGRYEFYCRSIDLGVAPDNINEKNRMCINGNISVDYLKQYPDHTQCVCPDGLVKILIPNTSMIRTLAACVPEKVANIL